MTVTGEAPLIERADASKGDVLDSQTLETLPAPGTQRVHGRRRGADGGRYRRSAFNRQQDQTNASLLSLGGGSRRGTDILDGVPIGDLRNRASANPTIEAIEEVKVQVHTYDAEMGRTGGGVFNVAAKSGTNVFHGSGFFQNRPNGLLTNDYSSELAGHPSRQATTTCMAAISADRSSRTGRSSGDGRRLRIEHDARHPGDVPDRGRAQR